MEASQAIVALFTGVTFFLAIGFSIFLYRGYRLAPIQQHRLLLIVGLAFAVSALAEFVDAYSLLAPVELSVGEVLPVGFIIRQSAIFFASVILFWYSYTTYYFIIKSSPEKEGK